MSAPTNSTHTADESPWYDWILNLLASVLVFFMWHLVSLGASKWLGGTEDHWLIGVVGMTVALHLHKVKRK